MKWSMLLASRCPVTFPPNSRFAVVRASPVGKSCPLGVKAAARRHEHPEHRRHEHPEHCRHEPGCTSEREHEREVERVRAFLVVCNGDACDIMTEPQLVDERQAVRQSRSG